MYIKLTLEQDFISYQLYTTIVDISHGELHIICIITRHAWDDSPYLKRIGQVTHIPIAVIDKGNA